jgi:hypothetical protein
MRFDPNISTLEEILDFSTIRMDELDEIFTTYEMRKNQENPSKTEATFKTSNKTKKTKMPESNPNHCCNDDLDEDEEITNFVRKLKKGTIKYKCMLPLKVFNCGKIGHFVNKCPYDKKSDSDEEDDPNKEKKYENGNIRTVFKKNIYSREVISSFDEYDVSDSDS